uniref:BHLH domain-containing protein n=1 Tax=Oryza meridionalis TaxID=40149 RepID=A0A0E0CXI0_9ORYZ
MDEQNQWLAEPEPEELTYMYHQEEHARMQEQFAGTPLVEQPVRFDQFYPTSMAPNQFHPSHCSSFPAFGGSSALPSLAFGAVATTTKKEQVQQPSPSSSNVLSFAGQVQGSTTTLDFSGRGWQQDDGVGVFQQPPERRSRPPANAQEHVIAERKRREKLQQQFVALATIVPGLKKTDKISLLGSTIDYVKQLEEKVKALEEGSRRTAEPTTAFESKCRITVDDDDGGSASSGADDGSSSSSSPTVEASIHGSTVLLKICCKERRGLLVMILSELEKQGLSIINTSVVPFTDSCLNITITAKARLSFTCLLLLDYLGFALV